jgi:hypothetical protein
MLTWGHLSKVIERILEIPYPPTPFPASQGKGSKKVGELGVLIGKMFSWIYFYNYEVYFLSCQLRMNLENEFSLAKISNGFV